MARSRFVRWRRASVEPDHGSACGCSSCCRPNDRQLDCARSSAHRLRRSFSERQSMGRRLAFKLLSGLRPGSILLADRGYDADWIRTLVCHHGAWANIPPKGNRTYALCFSPSLSCAQFGRGFFKKIKQCRRVATRYDKLAANHLAFIQLAQSGYGYELMSSRPKPLQHSSLVQARRLANRRADQFGAATAARIDRIFKVEGRGRSVL